MSEIYHRYSRGEVIGATELNTSAGLRLYGEVIHGEWRLDLATKQLGMDGEIYLQKVHPIEPPLAPEAIHLSRPSDTREGRRVNGA